MYPRSIGTHDHLTLVLPRLGISLVALLLGGIGILLLAGALPGVSRWFGQPCGTCYLGAFDPPLEPYGHPARRAGDTTANPSTPLSRTAVAPIAEPRESRLAGGLLWIAANEPTALEQPILIDPGRGEPTIDGPGRALGQWANSVTPDTQHFPAIELTGVMAASGATERDAWHAWPVWGAAPGRANWSAVPYAATDAMVERQTGGDRRWIDPRGGELTLYRVARRDGFNPAGLVPVAFDDFVPHWRIAMQKDLERHFPQIGAPAIELGAIELGTVDVVNVGATDPEAVRLGAARLGAVTAEAVIVGPVIAGQPEGAPDSIAGIAQGGDKPRIAIPAGDGLAQTLAHATALSLGAGFSLLGIGSLASSEPARAGTQSRFAVAVTPAIQYFPVAGPVDAVRYFWPDVPPSSNGVTAGLAYTPWQKPASTIEFLNLGFAARYSANKDLSGVVRGAGGGNTLVLSLWGALHF
jgi:hypothetical protein